MAIVAQTAERARVSVYSQVGTADYWRREHAFFDQRIALLEGRLSGLAAKDIKSPAVIGRRKELQERINMVIQGLRAAMSACDDAIASINREEKEFIELDALLSSDPTPGR